MKMNRKGFTLIELLTVIAILGIIVLLAAPKFLGYTEKANIAKVQSGIKAVETAIDLKALDNRELTKDWVVISPDKLQEMNESGKLINRKGFVKENLNGGKNIPLKDLDVKWESGGEFILSEDGENVYYYNKNMNLYKNPDGSANIPGDNGDNGTGNENGDENGSGNENGGNGSETPIPPAEPEVPTVPEITYPIELPNGDLEHEDGTITTPDGEGIRQPDGSAVYPDGTIVDKDGSVHGPVVDFEYEIIEKNM